MDETVWSAYLQRIAVPRPLTVDTVTLHVLHRAHQLMVPFENLSMHLAEPISLTDDALIEKIVNRARGGICYELNGAFALLLQSFDCQVTRVAARVYSDGQLSIPFDHMALIVTSADGAGPWLVDVGFGSNSMYPLLFESRHDQDDSGGQFLLVDTDDGDVDVLRDGKPQYRIERRERSLADFVPTCWWQQSSPASHFTHSTICSRLTETGRLTLSGDLLITTAGSTRNEEQLTSDEAILAAYRDHFGVALDRVPEVLFPPKPGPAAPAQPSPASPAPQASPTPTATPAPFDPPAPSASPTSPAAPAPSIPPIPHVSPASPAPSASPTLPATPASPAFPALPVRSASPAPAAPSASPSWPGPSASPASSGGPASPAPPTRPAAPAAPGRPASVAPPDLFAPVPPPAPLPSPGQGPGPAPEPSRPEAGPASSQASDPLPRRTPGSSQRQAPRELQAPRFLPNSQPPQEVQ